MKTFIIGLVVVLLLSAGGYALYTSNAEKDDIKNGITEEGTQGTNSAEGAPEGSIHNLPLPAGVKAVKVKAASEAKVNENEVVILSAFEKEWSDSCLGLGGPAESCLFVMTPGYEVTLTVKGKEMTYRSNADGTVIREEK